MKFPRNARIFRGQLDAAPFAVVFFLLVIFLMISSLVYTPGAQLELPTANDLPGLDRRSISVAIDAHGRMYYENQSIEEKELRERLRQAVKDSAEPLTLVLQADKSVTHETLIRLAVMGRDAGITQYWVPILPRPSAAR